MRTSGLFTTGTYEINVDSLNSDIFIVPFSDLHFGTDGFCEDTWREFREWGLAHPNAYFIGNGDYIDLFRATTRKHLQDNLDPNEAVNVDHRAETLVGQVARRLDFMRGRLIGLGDGNHGWTFRDGRNDTQILADHMGVRYLGVMAAIRITICYHENQRVSLTYLQHHGTPSGVQTVGGKFNVTDKMARQYDVDIIATGDDHRKGVTDGITRIRFVLNQKSGELLPVEYTPMLVRSGAFQRALLPGHANYVIDRNLGPLALGVKAVQVKLRRKQVAGKRSLRFKLLERGI